MFTFFGNVMNESILHFIILAPPLLLALTFHEFAHGYAAFRLGDPTAQASGRLTMNPLKHLDLLGTIAFFIFHFGWAKPVPVNPAYFKDPRKDMLWVALAGPMSNLVLAIVSALMVKGVVLLEQSIPDSVLGEAILVLLQSTLIASVWINLVLCIFNFLPIPPLDGSRILSGILPPALARSYLSIERYGFVLLILLAVTGVLPRLIIPVINLAKSLLLF
jgi:Zn-dependent protease